uniref:Protein m142 n=1 Tax=Mastomys natalensis cytomegalovirus 2 TaxID=2973540 RepID=A0A9Y1N6U9_9BETA|nr:protein m142 [Mastomys natalensis cytomegalovirus 2]
MDALCTAIRSGWFKDMRPTGIRPGWRYLTADAVNVVLHDFAEIFVAQYDPEAVQRIVQSESGRLLSLGAPTGWFLCLRPENQIVSFSGHPSWYDYGGIPKGAYVLLGQCIRRVRQGMPCEELRYFLYLGPQGQILCYHEPEETIFVVALDIDELARRGLVGSEILHIDGKLPRTTSVPARLVHELTALDKNNGKAIAERARLRQGRVILLHTPGEGDRPLVLCATEKCLQLWWPFCNTHQGGTTGLTARITRRLGTSNWYYLGAVGLKISEGPFVVESLLIILDDGSIVHVDPNFDVAWRIADDIQQLFCMGLIKLYLPRRRIDSGSVGRARLEAPGCAHVAEAGWGEYYDFYGVHTDRDLKSQLQWLMRKNRFEESSGTWDEVDSGMRRSSDGESKESLRRNVETADAMNDVRFALGEARGHLDDYATRFKDSLKVTDE